MTQAELAKASGVKQQMISKLESGKSQTTSDIVALATALDVSPLWLASGKEEKTHPKKEAHSTYEERMLMAKLNSLPKKLRQQLIGIIDAVHALTRLGFNVDLSHGENQRSFLHTIEKKYKALKNTHT